MAQGWFERELLDLWRISRTALSDTAASRFDRLQWTVAEFVKAHPDQPRKQVYLELTEMTRGYGA